MTYDNKPMNKGQNTQKPGQPNQGGQQRPGTPNQGGQRPNQQGGNLGNNQKGGLNPGQINRDKTDKK